MNPTWQVEKRFSDFEVLRKGLLSQGLHDRNLPTLPAKKLFGRFDHAFLDGRMAALQHFSSALLLNHRATHSDLVYHFFDVPGNLETLAQSPLNVGLEEARCDHSEISTVPQALVDAEEGEVCVEAKSCRPELRSVSLLDKVLATDVAWAQELRLDCCLHQETAVAHAELSDGSGIDIPLDTGVRCSEIDVGATPGPANVRVRVRVIYDDSRGNTVALEGEQSAPEEAHGQGEAAEEAEGAERKPAVSAARAEEATPVPERPAAAVSSNAGIARVPRKTRALVISLAVVVVLLMRRFRPARRLLGSLVWALPACALMRSAILGPAAQTVPSGSDGALQEEMPVKSNQSLQACACTFGITFLTYDQGENAEASDMSAVCTDTQPAKDGPATQVPFIDISGFWIPDRELSKTTLEPVLEALKYGWATRKMLLAANPSYEIIHTPTSFQKYDILWGKRAFKQDNTLLIDGVARDKVDPDNGIPVSVSCSADPAQGSIVVESVIPPELKGGGVFSERMILENEGRWLHHYITAKPNGMQPRFTDRILVRQKSPITGSGASAT